MCDSDIKVGTILYGYCNGFFDGDYGNKRIEAIGSDWVVCRLDDGTPSLAHFSAGWQRDEMPEMLAKWATVPWLREDD